MKKQRNIKTLMASIAILAITAGSLGTATYAWFTRGTQATATGFDFSAATASGIQISTDAETWKSNITEADFNTETGPQVGNRLTVEEMEPVSTIDGIANLTTGNFDFFRATYNDNTSAFALAQDTENYLVFDLYFQNQGIEDLTLSLTSASTVTDNALNDKDTSLATRVGFIVEGSSNDIATVIAADSGSRTYIWEPNSLTRSSTSFGKGAINSAKYNYNGIATDNDLASITAVDTYNILSADPAALYTAPVTTTKDIAIGDANDVAVLPTSTTGGQLTKIKVFVWMEGQDIDCNNGISAGDVVIALGFDSGKVAVTGPKTATAITTIAGVSTLSVSTEVAGILGSNYSAYVFQAGNDAAAVLDYREFFAEGTVTRGETETTDIELDAEVASGDYIVVVVSQFIGSITVRIETPAITNTVS